MAFSFLSCLEFLTFLFMTLSRKSLTLFLVLLGVLPALYAQKKMVTGKVTDKAGGPVPSASVRIKNTQTGTSTDMQGVFNLQVKPGDSLIISAVGFGDTTFITGGRSAFTIVLWPRSTPLGEATVTSTPQTTGNPPEATTEQIITDAFQNYVQGAEFSNGQYRVTQMTAVPPLPGQVSYNHAQIRQVVTTINGFGPLNTLTSGTMLPVLKHQEDTRGSRYLLKNFAHGIIVDNTGRIIADSMLLMNYDKIDGQLMIAQDARNYLEVDKEKVLAFAFKPPDTSFIFLNVPILSKINYFLLIASGPRYSVYKSIKTKFIKANYVSNGLTESGNNYDEYADTQTWFWVSGKDSAGIFELKKRSIKAVFASEKPRVDTWFSKHKTDDIDDHFMKGLIDYLNAP